MLPALEVTSRGTRWPRESRGDRRWPAGWGGGETEARHRCHRARRSLCHSRGGLEAPGDPRGSRGRQERGHPRVVPSVSPGTATSPPRPSRRDAAAATRCQACHLRGRGGDSAGEGAGEAGGQRCVPKSVPAAGRCVPKSVTAASRRPGLRGVSDRSGTVTGVSQPPQGRHREGPPGCGGPLKATLVVFWGAGGTPRSGAPGSGPGTRACSRTSARNSGICSGSCGSLVTPRAARWVRGGDSGGGWGW